MSAAQQLIDAQNLGVFESNRWLIRNVSLALHRGEITTLIGPNGAGKTTLSRALLGLMRLREGQVRQSENLRIGYVPQKLFIAPDLPLSVERFLRLTQTPPEDFLHEIIDITGIAHLLRSLMPELSGGEYSRVLLARAIAAQPDLLILDEPVQAVDFSGQIAFYELIAAIRDRLACGILLISHDLHIVMKQTDHVICLNGHICCEGAASDVMASAEYQRIFGKKGGELLTLYRHHHDHIHRGRDIVPMAAKPGKKRKKIK